VRTREFLRRFQSGATHLISIQKHTHTHTQTEKKNLKKKRSSLFP
jgi:hypothetical protein